MSCGDVLLHTDAIFCSENLCLVAGNLPISAPTITAEQELVRFNILFAHLFPALPGSLGMSVMAIKPSKSLTIKALLDGSFPTIKSTNDKPTPFVSFATVG
jgi:hypothetical protein